MKQRIYLDTSVISALHDVRAPDRQRLTVSFWQRLPTLTVSTSDLTREEIEGTPSEPLRTAMLRSLEELTLFAPTTEMYELAEQYIQAAIFTRTQRADSVHVAAATLTRQDLLLSWNFRHLVNRRRRAAVVALNISLGLSTPDIISPPEL